jgi:putative hydrolase of the HAD superfamily
MARLDPHAVDVWVFDLDNTLYPSHCDLFSQVSQRMGEFISEFLGIAFDEARAMQKEFFQRHGTTLRGLMVEHAMDPGPFLDYVHEIDLSPIPVDGRLERALGRLPGRKLIYTNGTTRHAERITGHLGVAHHFEAVFDIADSDYLPKPDPGPYRKMLTRYDVEPSKAVMVEDMVRNLAPAAAMGMTTVWVPGNPEWSGEGSREDYVHHVAENLVDWLDALTA